MNSNDRELEKHDLGEHPGIGPSEVPPLGEGPDMAETVRLLARISRMPAIRQDKVQQMKELISEGKLETPERLEETTRRLMEELGL
jgi:hypothetical protein